MRYLLLVLLLTGCVTPPTPPTPEQIIARYAPFPPTVVVAPTCLAVILFHRLEVLLDFVSLACYIITSKK